jgi:hypothetical protein
MVSINAIRRLFWTILCEKELNFLPRAFGFSAVLHQAGVPTALLPTKPWHNAQWQQTLLPRTAGVSFLIAYFS